LRDLRVYIQTLWDALRIPGTPENRLVQAMKKFLNFTADGVTPGNRFLHEVRRAGTAEEFHALCDRHLDSGELVPEEPPLDSGSFRGFGPLTE
jgi:hypothetical protein